MNQNKRQLILFLYGAIVSISCSVKERKVPISNLNLVSVDTVQIDVDSLTNTQKYVQLVNIRDQEFLIGYQPTDSSHNFRVYDLQKKEHVFDIVLMKIGPNGVGTVSYYATFVDFRNIYLTQINTNQIFVCDSSGLVKSKFDLSTNSDVNIYPMSAYPTIIQDNKIYTFAITHFEGSDFNPEVSPELIYDISKASFSGGLITYPSYEQEFDNSMEVWKASRCLGSDGNFVYSFAFSSGLFSIEGSKILKHEIHNPDFNEDLKPQSNLDLTSMEAQMGFFAEKGLYTHLLFDKYRDMYYRIFLVPGESRTADGKIILIQERPFKIEIIDKNFKLVGQKYFKGGLYNPYRVLISKHGVLIGIGNPQNPISDDYYQFELFEPKEI